MQKVCDENRIYRLGNLGCAIAKRSAGEGVDLTVWKRTKEKAASSKD
jgi:3-hydroxyisobutyrate dehydrogenase-like beta-hydroxyacid dehydrogenase